ncbi:MAG TPA: Calx-beta domain-containing protein [Pyrinomonadaceae bacterium]|jgi:hypothetical protein|nr:Calx-beta domain-containing protein [Pyrinomonadaceae bacterium]
MFSSPCRPYRRRIPLIALGLFALYGFIFVVGVRAQQQQLPSVPSIESPAEQPSTKSAEVSIQTKAERGQAPLGRLYDFLKAEPAKIHRLPRLDSSRTRAAETRKRVRIGEVRDFARPLNSSSDSSRYTIAEGDVRVMGVVSEGAVLTRVHFTKMALPEGARVFVYSAANPDDFYGPYEGHGPSANGDFWTPPMEGDGVVIEYFTPKSVQASSDEPFQVSAVSHIYTDPLLKSDAGNCNREVTADWASVAKSVGQLQFTNDDDHLEYVCTGTLLNNQAQDFTPYLLTANHCFNSQTEAQSLRVYWLYNTGDFPTSTTPHTDGATLLETKGESISDFTFVRLTGSLPGGLTFAGWDPNRTPAGITVTGIHHPHASHKRLSSGQTSMDCSSFGPCTNYTSVRWNLGTTEGGSSGSALFRGTPSDAKLVGTLTGGAASCSDPMDPDFYGRFSVTYPYISKYLGTSAPAPASIQFGQPTYNLTEGAGSISIVVNRTVNLNSAVTADYATSDTAGLQNCNIANHVASSRCDYVSVVGTLRFAAGQTSKTIFLPVVDDTYPEGPESFTIALSNPTGGAVLSSPATATINITDNGNDSSTAANPIDETGFFVRQHYIDFLGREPDPPGFTAWSNQIDNCVPTSPTCDRLSVSQGIYLSPEFRERGYFIYKFYALALGRKPTYAEFVVDRARVSGFQTDAELEQSKRDFIAAFMNRSQFHAIYDSQTTAQGYVNTLLVRGELTLPAATRDDIIRRLGLGEITRAQALRLIAESAEANARYIDEATIVMHYFGYLRREPDGSYQDWINILKSNGDSRNVTNGFVNSLEYRMRFGK